MKSCPYCAESIQDAAIVCRFCNHDLRIPVPQPKSMKQIIGELLGKLDRAQRYIFEGGSPKTAERQAAVQRSLNRASAMSNALSFVKIVVIVVFVLMWFFFKLFGAGI